MGSVKEIGEESLTFLVRGEHGDVQEIIGTPQKKFKRKTEEPGFVKLYLDDLKLLSGVRGRDMDAFTALIPRIGYDSRLDLTTAVRDTLIEELGWKSRSELNNSLTRLKHKGLLISAGRGSYLINPALIAKGGWEDVKQIRMSIVYDKASASKVVNTEFVREDLEPNKDF